MNKKNKKQSEYMNITALGSVPKKEYYSFSSASSMNP